MITREQFHGLFESCAAMGLAPRDAVLGLMGGLCAENMGADAVQVVLRLFADDVPTLRVLRRTIDDLLARKGIME